MFVDVVLRYQRKQGKVYMEMADSRVFELIYDHVKSQKWRVAHSRGFAQVDDWLRMLPKNVAQDWRPTSPYGPHLCKH